MFSVLGFSFTRRGAEQRHDLRAAQATERAPRQGRSRSSAVLEPLRGPLFGDPRRAWSWRSRRRRSRACRRSAASSSRCSIRRAATSTGWQRDTQALVRPRRIRAAASPALFTPFRADDPQLVVNIDRDRARSLGVPLREVTDALQVFLGSQYVNDFDFNNRAYRVYVQADQRFRAEPGRPRPALRAVAERRAWCRSTPSCSLQRDHGAAGHQPLQPVPLGGDHGQRRARRQLGPGDRRDGADGAPDAAARLRLRVGRAVARGDQGRLAGRPASSRSAS